MPIMLRQITENEKTYTCQVKADFVRIAGRSPFCCTLLIYVPPSPENRENMYVCAGNAYELKHAGVYPVCPAVQILMAASDWSRLGQGGAQDYTYVFNPPDLTWAKTMLEHSAELAGKDILRHKSAAKHNVVGRRLITKVEDLLPKLDRARSYGMKVM